MTALVLALLLAGDEGVEQEIRNKAEEVRQFLKTAKSERELRAAVADLGPLAERAYEINSYELSAKIYDQIERVAKSLKDVSLVLSTRRKSRHCKDVGRAYKRVLHSELAISANKGTGKDYLAVGEFYTFIKGDWDKGVRFLKDGSNPELRGAAELESVVKTPDEQVSLGDRWWGLGKKYQPRALHWYNTAWPALKGIDREKVRQRVRQSLQKKGRTNLPIPKGWSQWPVLTGTNADETYAKSGVRSIRLKAGSGFRSSPIESEPGRKYFLSAWVLSDGGTELGAFRLRMLDAAGKGITNGFFRTMSPADTPFWTHVTGELVAVDGTARIEVAFMASAKSGMVWIDDVSLKDENGEELLQNGGFE